MMKDLKDIEPALVWKLFEAIAAVPHPSGHEEALVTMLVGLADRHDLPARRDKAGNLRIDRPASPGREGAPTVLLQGHLDMVPQAGPGSSFDFQRDPIRLKREGNFISSAGGTTLGADNGLGVAAALALLFDPGFETGPLAGVFTLSEEVGLNGAMALDPAFLDGDFLLNLDSEDEGEICIGCAGGARLELDFPISAEPVPDGMTGVSVMVRNLAGGHSGINIGDRRGNAVRFAAGLLERCPQLRVADWNGGTLDNVIPREAVVRGAVSPGFFEELRRKAVTFAKELRKGFDAPVDFRIDVGSAPLPERVWTVPFQERVIRALLSCPDGPTGMDHALGVIRTSSNLAAIFSEGDTLKIRTSQRSLVDGEREKLTREIAACFENAGAVAKVDNAYPGWAPEPDSPLLAEACLLYRELFHRDAVVRVIHAGLECGILAGRRPGLKMISFGPTILDAHSPAERADVASTQRFFRFLRELTLRLGGRKPGAGDDRTF